MVSPSEAFTRLPPLASVPADIIRSIADFSSAADMASLSTTCKVLQGKVSILRFHTLRFPRKAGTASKARGESAEDYPSGGSLAADSVRCVVLEDGASPRLLPALPSLRTIELTAEFIRSYNHTCWYERQLWYGQSRDNRPDGRPGGPGGQSDPPHSTYQKRRQDWIAWGGQLPCSQLVAAVGDRVRDAEIITVGDISRGMTRLTRVAFTGVTGFSAFFFYEWTLLPDSLRYMDIVLELPPDSDAVVFTALETMANARPSRWCKTHPNLTVRLLNVPDTVAPRVDVDESWGRGPSSVDEAHSSSRSVYRPGWRKLDRAAEGSEHSHTSYDVSALLVFSPYSLRRDGELNAPDSLYVGVKSANGVEWES